MTGAMFHLMWNSSERKESCGWSNYGSDFTMQIRRTVCSRQSLRGKGWVQETELGLRRWEMRTGANAAFVCRVKEAMKYINHIYLVLSATSPKYTLLELIFQYYRALAISECKSSHKVLQGGV